jgi:cytochrome c553
MQFLIKMRFVKITLASSALLIACGGGGSEGGGSSGVNALMSEPTSTSQLTPTATLTFDSVSKVVSLPIEVLGPAGYVESVQFDLPSDVNNTDAEKLFLQCHRCTWRDASVTSGQTRGAKGSVRVNGGAWIDITDANVELVAADKAYGGIAGGLNTVRFSMPITGVQAGTNTFDFRFNADDGLTSGYRILSFNLLNSAGHELLSMRTFKNDNPLQWNTSASAADITEGKALWNGKVALVESPLNGKLLKAACASCHAVDGRDLKYFNYSNWSIETRSQFHGLSSQQGRQIAAYIRQLSAPAPAQARPWNPPYQPGPGLDGKPVAEWAAGAGLTAVLDSDAAMLQHLFPAGTTTTAVRAVIDKTKTINIRQMPISLQLPDWNDWLPHQHPLDLFETQFTSLPTAANASSINQAYADMRTFLAGAPTASLIPNAALYNNLHAFAYTSSHFHFPNYTLNKAIEAGVNADAARSSISRWSAVKQWEVMQEFSLEDKAPQVHGTYGEPRSWLTLSRNVFEIAPHRSAENGDNFAYQSLPVGKYQSTAWYHLQLALNAGNRKGITLSPMDWNYQPQHIVDLKTKAGGPAQPLRWVASHTKMHQQFADGMEMGETALGFRQIHVQRYVPGQGHGVLLDTLPQPLRLNVYESLLASTMDVLEAYPPQVWPRGEHDGGNKVEAADYVLTNKSISRSEMDAVCFASNMANCWYSAIPYFKEIGVSATTIRRMADWGKAMWPAPANNWDALRPS